MGTRVDFYAGRGGEAEWLGSYPFDGYPPGVFADAAPLFVEPITEERWRQWVSEFLAAGGDRSTTPDMGWPWPWDDSRTTDYAYAWDDGVIYGSCFGYEWFRVDPLDVNHGETDLEEGQQKTAIFPDMSSRKNMTLGRRSGVLVFGV